jgi:hypothetical protein
MGGVAPALDAQTAQALHRWEEEDSTDESDAFDFVADLPNLYAACFKMYRWSFFESLRSWTMFLVSISIFARASDVTTYCPTFEDTRLPPASEWDSDGLPKWIELGMRDWTWR